MIYGRKLQFISLPELTNGLSTSEDAEYYLKALLIKIQESPVEYKLEVEGAIITISNHFVSQYELVFRNNVYANGFFYVNSVWRRVPYGLLIFSDGIKYFIEEQLSTDNDTIFLPKLIEGV